MENKYVAFIDVLGFSELVFAKDTHTLGDYFETINSTLELINQTKSIVRSTLFSDCVVLFVDDKEDDFRLLLTAIQTIQAKLILKKIIFRGAVSYGELHFDKNASTLVGKGYINAYLLEREARYPRVIIDPIIIPLIAKDRLDFMKKFSNEKDISGLIHTSIETWNSSFPDDNILFVNYLGKIFVSDDYANEVECIMKFLKEKIYSSFKTQEKHIWLKNYFSELMLRAPNILTLEKHKSNKLLLENIYRELERL